MLVQFSVRNFKTFKDKVTLSLVASNYDKSDLEESNVFEIKNYPHRLLKSAVVYGANASGKTKMIDALAFMRWFVINSSTKTQEGDLIEIDTFRLNTETENASSEFEIIFLCKDTQVRYGFEVTKVGVVAEWLFQKKLTKKPKEIELFYREGINKDFHSSFKKIEILHEQGDIIRDNVLILSLANQFKVKEANDIVAFFKSIGFLLGNEPHRYEEFSLSQIFEKSNLGLNIIETLRRFDIGIFDLNVNEKNIESDIRLPKDVKNKLSELQKKDNKMVFLETQSLHKKYDSDYNFVSNEYFDFDELESAGTQKLLAVLGPIFESLESGDVLFIDELDSRLHPNIVSFLIELFNSKSTNPNNAQLIFNTHNTNLLHKSLFRRDQVWFMQKNRYGEAKIFSLADFKVRKEENFEEKYLEGKYGGIPFLEDISDLFNK
ncbi:hypothetical protein FLACOL_01792 [Flavobacterium columnare]|uniref:ATP-binding protein n=2 Tax=Flavobacterium TaxID=237 RepID=A0ABW8PPU9_9FLAO|nr:ATP-binding protein [Flavobacterium columnare]SPE77784.1 hypothetical protein FLACOL_01792 [Flavobacterium columnare]